MQKSSTASISLQNQNSIRSKSNQHNCIACLNMNKKTRCRVRCSICYTQYLPVYNILVNALPLMVREVLSEFACWSAKRCIADEYVKQTAASYGHFFSDFEFIILLWSLLKSILRLLEFLKKSENFNKMNLRFKQPYELLNKPKNCI